MDFHSRSHFPPVQKVTAEKGIDSEQLVGEPHSRAARESDLEDALSHLRNIRHVKCRKQGEQGGRRNNVAYAGTTRRGSWQYIAQ